VVCTTNDGPVRAFHPGWRSIGAPSLGVRLRGAPGNPAAIGARLELRDAKTGARELHAGAGYLSQSSPTAWLTQVPENAVLRVRWPDGAATEHSLEPRHGVQTIAR
jgi:hypothetical protein